jgi:hypothetical protein
MFINIDMDTVELDLLRVHKDRLYIDTERQHTAKYKEPHNKKRNNKSWK